MKKNWFNEKQSWISWGEKNVETTLNYNNGNRLALDEVELVHIISSRNQVDYNIEYDRKVFNDIADKLLDIAISSYSVIEGEAL